MSVAALKKVATAIFPNKEMLKKIGMILLIILLVLILPIGAIIALFSGQIDIDLDRLRAITLENLSDEERMRLEKQDTVMAEIETKMAGYDDEKKEEAKILYYMALYSFSDSDGFTDKLVGCFAEAASDSQLISAVNSTFSTTIEPEEFTRVMTPLRSHNLMESRG